MRRTLYINEAVELDPLKNFINGQTPKRNNPTIIVGNYLLPRTFAWLMAIRLWNLFLQSNCWQLHPSIGHYFLP